MSHFKLLFVTLFLNNFSFAANECSSLFETSAKPTLRDDFFYEGTIKLSWSLTHSSLIKKDEIKLKLKEDRAQNKVIVEILRNNFFYSPREIFLNSYINTETTSSRAYSYGSSVNGIDIKITDFKNQENPHREIELTVFFGAFHGFYFFVADE